MSPVPPTNQLPGKPPFEIAKRLYPYRFTMEHVPKWATEPHHGRYHAPMYETDWEWYVNTEFPLPGATDRSCIAKNPSWPLGRWLNQHLSEK